MPVPSTWTKFRNAQLFDQLSALVFALMVAVVGFTFRDYGLAWDESFHETYGNLILDFIASGGEDQRVNAYWNLHNYGGLFDAPAALAARVSPFDPIHTRHLLIAATGLLGGVGVWAMARDLGGDLGGPQAGPQAGFWAVVVLFTMPSFTGHMFINPKDIPFAVGTIWGLYFAMRVLSELPNVSARAQVGLGLSLGATMGVRMGGGVLVAYLAVLLLIHFAWTAVRREGFSASLHGLVRPVLVVTGVSCVLTFAFWPSTWPWMFDQALASLLSIVKFKHEVEVLFQGELVNSLALPWAYVPGYFAVKLPEVVVMLVLVSVPLALWRWGRAFALNQRERVFGYAALVLGIGFPVGFAMAFHSAHYDALRHFLFVLPPLSVLVGVELTHMLAWVRHKHVGASLVVGALVTIGLLAPVASMVQLHPYAYVYYNAYAGGVSGAERRYELDYWATSYREAAAWLRTTDKVAQKVGQKVTVYVCGPIDNAARFLPERFRMVEDLAQAQVFIATTRWNCDALVDAPVLHTVQRGGARLSVIKDLSAGYTLLGELPGTVWIDADYPRLR